MNAIKRNIPNIITLANLACGLFAILFAFEGDLVLSATFIFYGVFFDFFDGLLARTLKVGSGFGKQLDSLADMVTFGVAPGIIMYHLINLSIEESTLILFIGFLIPIFSAIRLAKFNVDEKQSTSFIGLPTPAAAIFVASLPLISKYQQLPMFTDFRFLIAISVILPLLLVAKIPLFSLKIKQGKDLKSKENIIRIIFLISCVILLFIFQFAAIPFIVILYLILSILNNFIK